MPQITRPSRAEIFQDRVEFAEEKMLIKARGNGARAGLVGARPVEQPYRSPLPWMTGVGVRPGLESSPRRMRITWEALREIPLRNPIFAAIENRFKRMAAQFLMRQPDRDGLGFRVALRGRRQNMTAVAQREADRIEDLLLRGGIPSDHPDTGERAVWNADFTEKADSFSRFLQHFLRGRLRFDMAALRIEPGENAKRYPIAFFKSIDGSRIRKALPASPGEHDRSVYLPTPYLPELRTREDRVAWVLLGPDYEATPGGVEREFRWDEVALEPQNPSEDPWCSYLGTPESEYCLDIMTGILYALDFNLTYFDNNHIPEGILALVGQYETPEGGGDDPKIQTFRRWLRMNVGGMGQMWSMPILAVNKALGEDTPQFIKFRENPGDAMYWKEWLLFCGSVAAAVYGMQAGELNFANFGQSRNPLSSDNLEEKVEYSTDTAFVPLMEYLSSVFSRVLVQRIQEDYEWQWVNLRPRSQEQHRTLQAHRLSTGLATVAEERTLGDLPPLRDPLDRDLWREVYGKLEKSEAKLKEDDEDSWMQQVAEAYEEAGGQFALWPTAPQGPLLQVWMAEHKIGMGGGPPEAEKEEWGNEGTEEPEGREQEAGARSQKVGGGEPEPEEEGEEVRKALALPGPKVIEVRIGTGG